MLHRPCVSLVLISALSVLGACAAEQREGGPARRGDGGLGEEGCQEGEEVSCACADLSQSTQRCDETGHFGPCACPDDPAWIQAGSQTPTDSLTSAGEGGGSGSGVADAGASSPLDGLLGGGDGGADDGGGLDPALIGALTGALGGGASGSVNSDPNPVLCPAGYTCEDLQGFPVCKKDLLPPTCTANADCIAAGMPDAVCADLGSVALGFSGILLACVQVCNAGP